MFITYFSAETSKPLMYTGHNFVIFEVEDNVLFGGRVDTSGKRRLKETVMRSFMINFSSHTIRVIATTRVR
jgi:hypothetical protein